jgi:prepilin-type N-terminal cleavage/methylation domain-containing protein
MSGRPTDIGYRMPDVGNLPHLRSPISDLPVRSRSGVTLIELLISISLLSLLSVGILMAMRVGLNATERANARLMANRKAVGAQRLLEQEIAGLMPEDARCMTDSDAPGPAIPFFQGEPESMRFVSSYSLQEGARGYPHIVEFQVIPGEKGQGVRLVMNERLYTGPVSTGFFCLGLAPDPESGLAAPQFRPIEIGPGSFVLADRLAFCRFLYQELKPVPILEAWTPHWIKPQWPSAIRIEMGPLADDASAIKPMTVTLPVRVNRVPLTQYADYYDK